MNRKQSRRTISNLLAAVGVFIAMNASGCATAHHGHHGDRDLNRIRNARIAAGVTLGILALGTVAWLYSKAGNEETKELAPGEGVPQNDPNGY